MLNTSILSQDNYSEVIKEDLISFVEIELVPVANSNLFSFSNKDINNTKIETKQESDQYRFDIDPRLNFENCTINNLMITISSYTSYISFNDCDIETLVIEVAADRYTDAVYFSNTNAKTIIIKELKPINGMQDYNSRRSYIRQFVFNNNDRNSYIIINNLIVEGFESTLKNRVTFKSSASSNTIIENLTINNYVIDSSDIKGSLYIDAGDQPQLVIKKLNLDNVSVTRSRNLSFKNISIDVQELNTWKRLEEIKSKTRFISRLSKDHPRFDFATLLLLTQVFETITNTGSVIDNEISKLNIPGVYCDKVDFLSSIQILPQTKLDGAEVHNQIINSLERTLTRDIMRPISNTINYLNCKSTITLEDLNQINFLINKTLRSKLNLRQNTNFVTISLDNNFRVYVDKSAEFFNHEHLIAEDSTLSMDFSSMFSTLSQVANTMEEERNARGTIREGAETVVALNRNRGRQSTANPTFRMPEALRNIVDAPTVTPTNFDPAFLQNRTTAVNTPPETTDTDTTAPRTFRDLATTATANSISESISTSLLDNIASQNRRIHRNPRYTYEQQIELLNAGVIDFEPSQTTDFSAMFMPRDPLSSLQINLEATPQYDINIFSESDDD